MLGAGAKGKVYLGMNLQNGELVAVKSLPIEAPRSAADAEKADWATNLGREVGFLAKLKHPNMVGYKSFSVARGIAFIVMEFVSGGTLNNMLEKFGALAESTVISYMYAILKGLAFLHQNDVIHGDIKLGNVLVETDGTCKISDFGPVNTLV